MAERARKAWPAVSVAAAAAAVLALAWLWTSQPLSATQAPDGKLLRQIAERGEIVIGIRAYRRPSPDPQARPEPDEYDLALAGWLSKQLGTRLRTVPVGIDDAGNVRLTEAPGPTRLTEPDVTIGLAPAGATVVQSNATSAMTSGGVVILPRAGQAHRSVALALAGTTLCAATGSPYTARLEQEYGARIQTMPSTIAAISAFTAFECAGVVADGDLLDRLQSGPDWAYYRRLPLEIRPAFADRASLPDNADAHDMRVLQSMLSAWTRSSEGRSRREQRLSLQAFESTLLQPGSYCH